eukprot:gene7369-5185_t
MSLLIGVSSASISSCRYGINSHGANFDILIICTHEESPKVSPGHHGHTLRQYSLLVGEGTARSKLESKKKIFLPTEEEELQYPMEVLPDVIEDVLAAIASMRTCDVTDKCMVDIFHPSNVNQYSPLVVATALKNRLLATAREVEWNLPEEIPDWKKDMRFLGQWWISLRQPDGEIMKKVTANLSLDAKQIYLPHLNASEMSSDDMLNKYVANVALRAHGKLLLFDLLHMDLVPLTAERMHVLWFDGLVLRALGHRRVGVYEESRDWSVSKQEEEEYASQGSLFLDLDTVPKRADSESKSASRTPRAVDAFAVQTVSFSICSISSSSLAVLLSALVTISGVSPPVKNLDLSYNCLDNSSLYLFVTMLPLTKIRRLSLRGNNLASYDPSSIRDFLLEGCYFIEELDLSITWLTSEQLLVVIDVLPKLTRLRHLLLNGIIIPDNFVVALVKVIATCKHLTVSADGSSERIQAALDAAAAHQTSSSSEAEAVVAMTFFEKFYQASKEKGWEPPDLGALEIMIHRLPSTCIKVLGMPLVEQLHLYYIKSLFCDFLVLAGRIAQASDVGVLCSWYTAVGALTGASMRSIPPPRRPGAVKVSTKEQEVSIEDRLKEIHDKIQPIDAFRRQSGTFDLPYLCATKDRGVVSGRIEEKLRQRYNELRGSVEGTNKAVRARIVMLSTKVNTELFEAVAAARLAGVPLDIVSQFSKKGEGSAVFVEQLVLRYMSEENLSDDTSALFSGVDLVPLVEEYVSKSPAGLEDLDALKVRLGTQYSPVLFPAGTHCSGATAIGRCHEIYHGLEARWESFANNLSILFLPNPRGSRNQNEILDTGALIGRLWGIKMMFDSRMVQKGNAKQSGAALPSFAAMFLDLQSWEIDSGSLGVSKNGTTKSPNGLVAGLLSLDYRNDIFGVLTHGVRLRLNGELAIAGGEPFFESLQHAIIIRGVRDHRISSNRTAAGAGMAEAMLTVDGGRTAFVGCQQDSTSHLGAPCSGNLPPAVWIFSGPQKREYRAGFLRVLPTRVLLDAVPDKRRSSQNVFWAAPNNPLMLANETGSNEFRLEKVDPLSGKSLCSISAFLLPTTSSHRCLMMVCPAHYAILLLLKKELFDCQSSLRAKYSFGFSSFLLVFIRKGRRNMFRCVLLNRMAAVGAGAGAGGGAGGGAGQHMNSQQRVLSIHSPLSLLRMCYRSIDITVKADPALGGEKKNETDPAKQRFYMDLAGSFLQALHTEKNPKPGSVVKFQLSRQVAYQQDMEERAKNPVRKVRRLPKEKPKATEQS